MRPIPSLLLPATLALATLAAPHHAAAQALTSADAVIAKNIQARGGIKKLQAVKTTHMTGRIEFTAIDGAAGPLTIDFARPASIRTEFALPDEQNKQHRFVQAYDGKTAWALTPPNSAAPLPPDLAKNVAAGADMDGPLVDYVHKGNRLTFLGVDTADGRPAYKIRVVTADSLDDTYYIDTVSFLQTKWEGKRVSSGKVGTLRSVFRDYRAVDGIQFAFKVESSIAGQPGVQRMTFDAVEINVPLSSSRFTLPTR